MTPYKRGVFKRARTIVHLLVSLHKFTKYSILFRMAICELIRLAPIAAIV